MSRASVTSRGRAAAEGGFDDTCVITRAGTGKGAFNTSTGQYAAPARVTVYSGPCRIQVTALIANSSASSAGQRAATVQASELQLPIAGTGDVSIKDVAKITASAHDAELVDREFTIDARHEKTHATSRRLRVSEVTG